MNKKEKRKFHKCAIVVQVEKRATAKYNVDCELSLPN